MRSWYGRDTEAVTGNSFRRTLRDFPIFEMMEEGDDFTRAASIADRILAGAARIQGLSRLEHEEEYNWLKRKIVPPYDRTKFLSKWKKLYRNRPSHTLTAHLGVDTYSHIHPWEPRGISVREAARLQSFPDEFLFFHTMSDAFRQIGNAVPPILAKAIAEEVFNILTVGRGA
jgi:DNA (cytosine-5)-methyltransferase 1